MKLDLDQSCRSQCEIEKGHQSLSIGNLIKNSSD